MTVTLIAENILDADDFLSATEQEGARWGQPMPASGNAGSLRPVVKGTPVDLTFSNSTNLAGAAGGTTLVCGNLQAYGDHVFAGASVVLNSGTYSGQERTVSSFTQASGTLTVSSAFGGQVAAGVTFTLTLEYGDLDYKLYGINAGDLGDAYFKFSVDGGISYLGRTTISSNWFADTEVRLTTGALSARHPWRAPLVQADDGYWLLTAASSGSAGNSYSYKCLDPLRGGDVWEGAGTVSASDKPVALRKLKSGRLICVINDNSYGIKLSRSDDHGESWETIVYYSGLTDVKDDTQADLIELDNGDFLLAYTYESADNVYCRKSTDGGETWTDAITIAADTNNQLNPALCLCEDGTIICAYETDEDSSGDYEIKCKRSTDNGATWGSAIDVIDFAEDITNPCLLTDNEGYVYCAAQYGAGSKLVFTYSSNYGLTWNTMRDLYDPAALTYYPYLAQIGGTRLVCTYWDETNDRIKWVTKGMISFHGSSTAIWAPKKKKPIELLCGAELEWYGGEGSADDTWDFEAEYDFAMENIIEDSPSKPWRSEQQNIACNIVMYKGSRAKHYVDGVAFFGCNVRSLSFQMNASDSWGSPSVDETIYFDLTTAGVLDAAADENYIKDAALMAGYHDHELKDCYVQFTSGALSGYTYKIIDNVGDYIVLEEIFAFQDFLYGPVATDDTFAIFQDHVAKTFTGGLYQYMRIAISAQRTSPNEAYYQIGMMVAGKKIDLSDAFQAGYSKNHEYGITHLSTPSGGLISVFEYGRKRRYGMGFKSSTNGRKELLALLDYLEDKNLCLILDNATLTDCQLVKLKGAVEQEHVIGEYFSLDAEFEEVL